MQMAIPLYLTTIEQDIFDTFQYLPHAVAVGVGFVTLAAAWKNQQMQKKHRRMEKYHAVHGGQLLVWFLVVVYLVIMVSRRFRIGILWKIFCCFCRSVHYCRQLCRFFGNGGAVCMRHSRQV